MTKDEAIKKSIKHWETLTEEEAIDDCKQHWRNMIAYGKKQPPCEIVGLYDFGEMKIAIGERPTAADCALCQLFLKNSGGNACLSCPLYKNGFRCNGFDSPYSKVMRSGNWGEFVTAAEKMLKVLESL